MIVEIKGVQFVNKGAELMLFAILQQLKIHLPDAELALLPGPNAPYAKRAALGALQIAPLQFYKADLNWIVNFMPLFMRKKLRQWFGIIFQRDVELVLDASGFAYGDRWGRFGVKFLEQNIRRIKQRRGRYILLPQAFGPFSNPADKKKIADAVSNCCLVYARDEESRQYLLECGCLAESVQLAPDFTNLLEPAEFSVYEEGTFYSVLIPNHQMFHSKEGEFRDKYLSLMINYIRLCRLRHWPVLILNHEGRADELICAELKSIFKNDAEVSVIAPESALDVKACIADAGVVFSSRFHGCVSALSQGVSCIGTAWSHKYQHLYADYDASGWLLDIESGEQEINKLLDVATDLSFKNSLKLRSSQLKHKACNMWLEIADKIAGLS